MNKILAFIFSLVATLASAQDGPNHAVPIFGGPGFIGFRAAGPCATGQALTWVTGTGADPTCLQTTPNTSGKAYFVTTTGNDANDGLTWATAKLTIQAALDAAATAGVVNVGAGTYTLTSSVKMRPGVHLLCIDGATITQGAAQNLLQLIEFNTNSAHFAVLENCTVNGARSTNTDNTSVLTVWGGAANDITIRNNTILNSNGFGIDVGSGLRPRIIDNNVTNVYAAGIAHITGAPQSGTYSRIEGNRLFPPLGQHAIMVVNADFASVRGNKIDAGTILGGPSNALNVSTSGTTVTYVSGPNFSTVSAGQFLTVNSGLEFLITAVTDSTHLQVTPSPGTLGSTPASIGTGDVIQIDSSSFAVVTDNFITGGVTQGIGVSTTTGTEAAQKNLVANNVVTLSGEMCIGVAGVTTQPVNDTSVIGNNLSSCGQSKASNGGTALANSGISVFNGGAATNNTYIDGNYVQGTSQTINWLAVSGISVGNAIVGKNGFSGTTVNGVSGDITTIVLSAGWGTTAATSAIVSQGHSVSFTVTANGAGIAANPTIAINKLVAIPDNPPIIICKMTSGTGAITVLFAEQNATAGQWFTGFAGTPVAGSTYNIQCRG